MTCTLQDPRAVAVVGGCTVRLCLDAAFIDHLFSTLHDSITVDGAGEVPAAATMLGLPGLFFLEVSDSLARHGAFMFVGEEVHTMLLPSLRGGGAVSAARAALEWIWANTDFPRVTSYAHSNARHVLRFAKAVGMHETGTHDERVSVKGRRVLTTRLEIPRPL